MVGYLEGVLCFAGVKKHSFDDVLRVVDNSDFPCDMRGKIEELYNNSKIFNDMQDLLFSGAVSDYLKEFLANFAVYIDRVFRKCSLDSQEEGRAYKALLRLAKTKDFDLNEIKKFLDLSDIKRADI